MPKRGGPMRVESEEEMIRAPFARERFAARDAGSGSPRALRAGPPRKSTASRRRRRYVRSPEGDMTCCEPVLGLFARCRHMIEGHPDCLVVDLRGVGKADTKLAACLVALYKVAEASSVKLELQTSEAIQDVLTLYRLQGLIDRTRPGAL